MADRGDPTSFADLDHIGAASTPLLSDALLSTRGGIVGFWDIGTVSASPRAKDWDAFRKLGPEVRAAILDGELMQGFAFGDAATGYYLGVEAPGDWTAAEQKEALEEVRRAADLRDDRLHEIYAQQKDMMSFFGALFDGSGGRFARTLEFIDAVLRYCVTVEMRFKFEFGRPRPAELAPEVMPIIETPGHGSYPSGHAVESTAIAHVLDAFSAMAGRPGIGRMAYRLRDRIAFNRVVAGVHYISDNDGGFDIGTRLATEALAKATAGTETPLQLLYLEAVKEWT